MNPPSDLRNTKVYYRPIEAAIRWSNLLEQEASIITETTLTIPLNENSFSLWPAVGLNIERLFDAMFNGELSYGKDGITSNDTGLLADPQLTIRHVDLKQWMAKAYPGQKPCFLFDEIERQLHSSIDLGTVHTLLLCIETLKTQLALGVHPQRSMPSARDSHNPSETETIFLNIIGGLLTLLLGQSQSGVRYSSFNTLKSVIGALIAHHNGRIGITECTLWTTFSEAKRQLAGQL